MSPQLLVHLGALPQRLGQLPNRVQGRSIAAGVVSNAVIRTKQALALQLHLPSMHVA